MVFHDTLSPLIFLSVSFSSLVLFFSFLFPSFHIPSSKTSLALDHMTLSTVLAIQSLDSQDVLDIGDITNADRYSNSLTSTSSPLDSGLNLVVSSCSSPGHSNGHKYRRIPQHSRCLSSSSRLTFRSL
ncbi:hypothetical protein Pst134EA_015843 [Puccinia striiformis f. sp. tritici]|uniref:hypothetical protein n=1 Tax=Puccinia striiformis f. sp. tritici TaxID=168172 RepID=UPI002008757D|nr:hypothetical protein Pst134EA_015843 [Puccinia striiformis f. sp. tritici]KAH9463759.1 hypothetical protein Pst134EA_015843 [Puccinia striiformis f. sp. tritici]